MLSEIWRVTDIIFCHFRLLFTLLPTNNPENQNFEKMKKKAWRYYNFTHVYQKWHSYDVWFPSYGARQANLFNILGLFLPSYPTKILKNQNFKKMKIHLEILSFYTSAPKIMITSHTVFEIWCATDVIFLFFALGTSSFYTCAPKIMISWHMVPEKWCKTDRQTAGQTNRWIDR